MNLIDKVKMSFFLRIDERWSSPEILKARKIIHELSLRHNGSVEEIGKEILGKAKNPYEIEEFVLIRNFLDFMETIGFLYCNNKDKAINACSLYELCGESLIFNFKIFKKYIDDIQEKAPKRKLKGKEDSCAPFQHFKRLIEDLEGLCKT